MNDVRTVSVGLLRRALKCIRTDRIEAALQERLIQQQADTIRDLQRQLASRRDSRGRFKPIET